MIIGRAPETRKSAKPEASSSHTGIWDAYVDTSSSRARSANYPPAASMFSSPGAKLP